MFDFALVAACLILFIVVLVYAPFFTLFFVIGSCTLFCSAPTPIPAAIMMLGLVLEFFCNIMRQGITEPVPARRYRSNEYDFDDPS